MTRIFLSGTLSHYEITKGDLYHLEKVLRMRVKDELEVVLEGKIYHAMIESFSPFFVSIQDEIDEHRELPFPVTLLYCLAKGDKTDWVMQKAVELGISRVVGVISSRTVVKLDAKEREKKAERYGKIMREAAYQCKRSVLPVMEGIIDFKEISSYLGKHNYIAYEEESLHGTMLKGPFSGPITILIGSEGGFSKEEVEKAIEQGFEAISLGKRILRSETAAIASLATLAYLLEEDV